MASKRTLKKNISFICSDIACECLFARDFIPGFNAQNMDKIVDRLANLLAVSLARVNISFDKVPSSFDNRRQYNKAAKKYFKEAYSKLSTDFSAQVNEIVKEMNKEMPQSVKDSNKR